MGNMGNLNGNSVIYSHNPAAIIGQHGAYRSQLRPSSGLKSQLFSQKDSYCPRFGKAHEVSDKPSGCFGELLQLLTWPFRFIGRIYQQSKEKTGEGEHFQNATMSASNEVDEVYFQESASPLHPISNISGRYAMVQDILNPIDAELGQKLHTNADLNAISHFLTEAITKKLTEAIPTDLKGPITVNVHVLHRDQADYKANFLPIMKRLKR